MKIVNKTEFPLIHKLMNSLLDKFKAQGWSFPEKLPEIYFSDEVILLPTDKENGFRGINPDYSNNDNYALLSSYNRDGELLIIIYERVLLETAKKLEEDDRYIIVSLPSGGYEKVDKRNLLHFKQKGIENDYGISFEEARENLFYCAVLNEFSKWILVDTPIKDTWKDNPLNKYDHLHECLTALLSYWVCNEGSRELNNSFVYLMFLHKKGEDIIGKYNRYSEYENFDPVSVINCIAICRKENYEYFELLNLLLEIFEKDNTLNSNNFKNIIINNKAIQNLVKKSYMNHVLKRTITDILYELFDSDNKESFYSHQEHADDYEI